MCGIAGYIGPLQAQAVLLVALERLKYRGYDSAGIAINHDGEITCRKSHGKLTDLEKITTLQPVLGHCGIAHTRWATHGIPDSGNAHPHSSGDGSIAVVHNGIIENHQVLRDDLESAGVLFSSQTDSEVIPHLLERHYEGDPLACIRTVLPLLRGSYAFAAVFDQHPGHIYVARQGSPLLIGRGKGQQVLLASDIPALLPHAHEYLQLQDGQLADLSSQEVCISTFSGDTTDLTFLPIELDVEAISKGDFDSFMAKEIAEQPEILQRLLESRLHQGTLAQPDLGIDLRHINHVVFLAAGTSWHAAQLGKRFLEHLARVHVEVDISSEYRYRNPVASGGTLVVAISQSGETADTLASLRLAKSKFIPVISLINVLDSTIGRESDGIMPLLAGPEIGVASTKAYTAQVLALYCFALHVARVKGQLSTSDLSHRIDGLHAIPHLVAETLRASEASITEAAELFTAANGTVFLGRGGEFPTALEGALKLKEISYVHAMGYAGGEFKHGPIALVTPSLPVVCICPRDAMYDKMISNIEEVRARQGRIISVGDADDQSLAQLSDHLFPIQRCHDELLQPLLSILPLQRYAYHIARNRGCDVDQPRNLAKSVTVE
ncbi:MAG: glutamine--fructose-6-phosphate transaminase (isomerizing) [Planctomycetota bacterium]|nr:MAG: glutamine--fructose-6-phosphate transaminase (isomerizing) [Planctomycetota bacterium]